MKKMQPFGYSLLLDMYGCKNAYNLETCFEFLANLPGLIGMIKQCQPFMFKADETLKKPGSEKGGISSWIPLIESSIQLHTIRSKNFVSVDVYSCKYFDKNKVLAYAKKYFSPKTYEIQFLKRGIEYGKIK